MMFGWVCAVVLCCVVLCVVKAVFVLDVIGFVHLVFRLMMLIPSPFFVDGEYRCIFAHGIFLI